MAKLEAGISRMGHIFGLGDDSADTGSHLTLDDKGALVTRPFRADFTTAFERNETLIPATLYFEDSEGSVTLLWCRSTGTTSSSRGAHLERLRARVAIASGQQLLDYRLVDGMCSDLDGLARWSGLSTIRQSVVPEEGHGVQAIEMRAENVDPIALGGALNLTLSTAFTHNPRPKGNVYSFIDLLNIRSTSSDPIPWEEHRAAHGMIQDLISMVYAHPCEMRLKSVKREDDQPYLEGTEDERRTWRDAYDPRFGRGLSDARPLARDRTPLFTLADTDLAAVSRWIDGYEIWSRPSWILASTLFATGVTVENNLLQIGCGLEALGYSIALQRGEHPESRNQFQFTELLQKVTEAVEIDHPHLFGELTSADWIAAFNRCFKGTKHADNSLPESSEALLRSQQGFMLARCWLARKLGVSTGRLQDLLDAWR